MKKHIVRSTKKAALWLGMVLFGAGMAGALGTMTANAQMVEGDYREFEIAQKNYENSNKFSIGHRFPFAGNVTGYINGRFSPSPFAPEEEEVEVVEDETFYSSAYYAQPYNVTLDPMGYEDRMMMEEEHEEPMHSGAYSVPMLPQTGSNGLLAILFAIGSVVALSKRKEA